VPPVKDLREVLIFFAIMNEDDMAEIYDPFGASEEKIQEAIDGCPVNCISWE
jgi:ferredoxin